MPAWECAPAETGGRLRTFLPNQVHAHTHRNTLLNVRPEGIPTELKRRPQWVVWKLEERDGKPTKVPYTPRTGQRASSTDLLTWSTFEGVYSTYSSGRYDGIGFMFCSGDPYTGVDLDDCRDPETGEIERWAAEIIESLDSYTELSPSGTGVHIFVKGRTIKARKNSSIEVYSTARVFTVTGVRP
jgi:putative DNA primase/helicase